MMVDSGFENLVVVTVAVAVAVAVNIYIYLIIYFLSVVSRSESGKALVCSSATTKGR